MCDNACLGGGWPVLTGVCMQRDARCGRNKIRQPGCLDIIANDTSQVNIAAQVSQVSSYISCATQGVCLRTDLHHRYRGFRRDTSYSSPQILIQHNVTNNHNVAGWDDLHELLDTHNNLRKNKFHKMKQDLSLSDDETWCDQVSSSQKPPPAEATPFQRQWRKQAFLLWGKG